MKHYGHKTGGFQVFQPKICIQVSLYYIGFRRTCHKLFVIYKILCKKGGTINSSKSIPLKDILRLKSSNFFSTRRIYRFATITPIVLR